MLSKLHKIIGLLLVALALPLTGSAGSKTRIKYPGGKYYIWRYTLKDKQGSTYSIEHPGRWLSHKSIERPRPRALFISFFVIRRFFPFGASTYRTTLISSTNSFSTVKSDLVFDATFIYVRLATSSETEIRRLIASVF